jgi:calcineurin-like phosphoesterase family protein
MTDLHDKEKGKKIGGKRIWLITDTHFNHDKMPLYCGRPENHTEIIGNNLLNTVFMEGDVLIHLGDICIGKDEEMHELYIEPLKCKKWLIKGNHDHKSDSWYLSHGWDWVGFKFQNKYFGKNIMFSHAPVLYTEEQSALFGSESFDINIHGHFHNKLSRLEEKRWVVADEEYRNKHDLAKLTYRHKLLAIEYTDYQPVQLKTFLNL